MRGLFTIESIAAWAAMILVGVLTIAALTPPGRTAIRLFVSTASSSRIRRATRLTRWMRRCGIAGISLASTWLVFFAALCLNGIGFRSGLLGRLTFQLAEWLTRPDMPYRSEAGAQRMWLLTVCAGLLFCGSLLLWSGGRVIEQRVGRHGIAA